MPTATRDLRVLAVRGDEVVTDPADPLDVLAARPDQTLWVDVSRPSAELLGPLADVFHLHPLAVEDALQRRQRPKAEDYADVLFITTHAARVRGRHDVALDEIDIFAGPAFVITVHAGTPAALDEARRRLLQAAPALRRARGYALYAILDAIVDSYFPVLDALDEDVGRLEDTLFRAPTRQTMSRLFGARRVLLHLRRVAAPQRDILNLLMRHDSRAVSADLRLYFRDIYDHLLRITEQIDTHRDLLSGAMDIYLGIVSNRLNEVVKVLTVITAVFASLAVITGFYGMNFERTWPPFDASWGALAALGLMAAVVGGMLLLFGRKGWL